MLKCLFIPLLCIFINSAFAQLTLTGYSTFAVGAETKLYKKINGEFRIFTNNILDEADAEIQLFYGFNARKYHQIRIGLGLNGELFNLEGNALQIPLQLIIFPLQEVKKLSFVIEVTPQFLDPESLSPSDIILRHLWGIRYTFGGE
jgi:hypothetical protein